VLSFLDSTQPERSSATSRSHGGSSQRVLFGMSNTTAAQRANTPFPSCPAMRSDSPRAEAMGTNGSARRMGPSSKVLGRMRCSSTWFVPISDCCRTVTVGRCPGNPWPSAQFWYR